MGLITLNLKRVLNWNFIFMSAVAAIFGMISLMNFGDISENIVFGVDIKYFMLDGYLCLFIFFAGEISKDMLQQEKITKRIEWKLANGIKISSIPLISFRGMLHGNISDICLTRLRSCTQRRIYL